MPAAQRNDAPENRRHPGRALPQRRPDRWTAAGYRSPYGSYSSDDWPSAQTIKILFSSLFISFQWLNIFFLIKFILHISLQFYVLCSMLVNFWIDRFSQNYMQKALFPVTLFGRPGKGRPGASSPFSGS